MHTLITEVESSGLISPQRVLEAIKFQMARDYFNGDTSSSQVKI